MSNGTGRLYKRGNTWWLDYGHRGKRYRESSGSHRKKDARALLKERMGEMGKGQFVGPLEERLTLRELLQLVVEDYEDSARKTLPNLRTAIKHLEAHFGADTPAIDITSTRIKGYVRARRDGYAAGTIRRHLAVLNRAYNLATDGDRPSLSHRPRVPTVHVDNTRENFLSMSDVDAICTEIGPDLAPAVLFAACTGWRKQETLGLRWAYVDLEAGWLRLEGSRSKNGQGREFPFHLFPELAEVIHEQRARTDRIERERGMVVPWVFHRDGEPIRSMYTAWLGACKRAGVPEAWFHDLRRCAVRSLERAGVPRSDAMKLTGHKTESIYNRYSISDSVRLEEAVEKLARYHGTRKPSAGRQVVPLRAGNGTKTAQLSG
jgi:integrase